MASVEDWSILLMMRAVGISSDSSNLRVVRVCGGMSGSFDDLLGASRTMKAKFGE